MTSGRRRADRTRRRLRRGWTGRHPSAIEGETNPDLALYDGREYEFVVENAHGDTHNLAIWDDDETPLHSTLFLQDEGDDASMTVELSEAAAIYLCETHDEEMVGGIEVRTQ